MTNGWSLCSGSETGNWNLRARWQARVDAVRAHGLELARGAPAGPAAEPEVQAVTPSVDYEIVSLGSSGEWVTKLQQALGTEANGTFDDRTEAALRAFQEETGLTVDGVASRNTYQALGLIA